MSMCNPTGAMQLTPLSFWFHLNPDVKDPVTWSVAILFQEEGDTNALGVMEMKITGIGFEVSRRRYSIVLLVNEPGACALVLH